LKAGSAPPTIPRGENLSDAKALKKEIDALGGERVNIADYLR